MTDNIKACPFCGSDKLERAAITKHVFCPCGANMPMTQWNARALQTATNDYKQLQGALEALKRIRKRIHAERYECTPLTVDDATTDAEKELMCIIDFIAGECDAAKAALADVEQSNEWKEMQTKLERLKSDREAEMQGLWRVIEGQERENDRLRAIEITANAVHEYEEVQRLKADHEAEVQTVRNIIEWHKEELGRAAIDPDVWQSASNARNAIIDRLKRQVEVLWECVTHYESAPYGDKTKAVLALAAADKIEKE